MTQPAPTTILGAMQGCRRRTRRRGGWAAAASNGATARPGAAMLALVVALLAGLAAGAVMAVTLLPGPAWARDEPPVVQGLTVADAQTALLAWDKSVQISYQPDPAKVPDGVDRATVVVLRSDWQNPTPIDPEPPRISLALGAQVPDLTGLTLDAATTALTTRGLVASSSGPAPTDWVVATQQPAPGTLLDFGARVVVVLAAPGSLTPPPEPTHQPPVQVWLLVAVGVLLVVAIAVTTIALRRRSRRRRRRRPLTAPERVEVRGSPGPVQGPDLSETQPGASLSVGVMPHYDPGTLSMQEVPR